MNVDYTKKISKNYITDSNLSIYQKKYFSQHFWNFNTGIYRKWISQFSQTHFSAQLIPRINHRISVAFFTKPNYQSVPRNCFNIPRNVELERNNDGNHIDKSVDCNWFPDRQTSNNIRIQKFDRIKYFYTIWNSYLKSGTKLWKSHKIYYSEEGSLRFLSMRMENYLNFIKMDSEDVHEVYPIKINYFIWNKVAVKYKRTRKTIQWTLGSIFIVFLVFVLF